MIPEPAFPFDEMRRRLWDALWSQPAAAEWGEVLVAPLTRMVVLQTSKATFENPRVLSELRQLEERFGLVPDVPSEDDNGGSEVEVRKPDPTRCVRCRHPLKVHARGKGVCRHTDGRGRCQCKKAQPPSPLGTIDRPVLKGRIPSLVGVSPFQPDKARTDMSVSEVIVSLVADGFPDRAACRKVGVFPNMACQWRARGEKELARLIDPDTQPDPIEEPYAVFALEYAEAVASRDMDAVTAMRKRWAKDGYRAIVRTMQVVERDSWDDSPKRTEISGPGGRPIETVNVPSLEQVEADWAVWAAQHPGVLDVGSREAS